MSKQELYEQITTLFNQFTEGHNSKFKKGAGDARKALGSIKKLITPYNRESIAEGKAAK
jgi:hypothetical protein